ncbi:hypothetical protein J0B03_00630 [Alkalibacter rhizosphaerae]|uniref:ferredoxin:thioredoxin reductase n=1 Tax=Alkalibacter rhizosphaerae TaxID=2815577 RepID=A0A974XFA0_9FIRM|nr:ferredoxin-thioredoxin reductase catalytic domain-containing protein [Alkalibacter rhizosphaerae]QSX08631.1 hypothetical protein J0B03_00630 [Alkalibacter rhizosphaerae]
MIDQERINEYLKTLQADAENGGYLLNPDREFLEDLAQGLLENTDRYGYQACPCRLANGNMEKDLDIICPCDYRDEDLNDYGACYCALYVNESIANGEQEPEAIPDRRKEVLAKKSDPIKKGAAVSKTAFPVWRCKVCGYLCARKNPPERCPICKAQKERFEEFVF